MYTPENMCSINDEELQRRAVSGDRDAEEQLVKRYTRQVRACARPYFLAGGDSEDLIQEGMLGLISAIREYTPDKAIFKTYAEVCIRRRLYTAIKTAARNKHTPLNDCVSFESPLFDENQTQAGRVQISQRGPEEVVIARERADEIISACSGNLSGMEAEILGLYLKGLSYQEIANEVKRSPKSVDNAVQRIRKKLVQHFMNGDISLS